MLWDKFTLSLDTTCLQTAATCTRVHKRLSVGAVTRITNFKKCFRMRQNIQFWDKKFWIFS